MCFYVLLSLQQMQQLHDMVYHSSLVSVLRSGKGNDVGIHTMYGKSMDRLFN